MQFNNLQDWLNWQEKLHNQSIDLGLDRIRPVFNQLITRSLAKKVVMVAGTNGKGSIVSFLESLFVSGGYQVGTYTSPHLLDYNERIRINGQAVLDNAICDAFSHVEQCRAETSLTYFEFGTLAAFDVFQHHELDIVILEVGLGGRLDAVNLVDADVAVVSNIQLDHMDWLGETREKIAIEKLAIARKGKPLIIADDDLPENIKSLLLDKEITADLLGKTFGFTYHDQSWDWWYDIANEARRQKHSLPLPSLRGAHQFKNASAALCVTALLQNDLPLSMSHIRVGLSHVSLPGRFQLERIEDKTVILDVSHNPHGIQAFIKNLKQLPSIGDTYLVFGMLKDKAIIEIISLLDPVIDHWMLSGLKNQRAISPADLKSAVVEHTNSAESIESFQSVEDACQQALLKMGSNDKLLVVGSFYTVSDAIKLFKSYG